MKYNRFAIFSILILFSGALAACSGRPSNNWPGMAADGKNVYISEGQYVYMAELSTGQERMTTTADNKTVPIRFPMTSDIGNVTFYAAPTLISDGQLIIGSASQNNESLFSINASNASLNWSFTDAKGLWLASALILNNIIYAPGGDGKLYALDANKNIKWETKVSNNGLWTSPASDGKLIFISTIDHEIVALDAGNGNQQWKIQLDNAILGAPAVGADGNLYVGTLSGNLYALKSADGSQIWKQTLQGGIWSTPALDGNILYVGVVNGTSGKIFAINTSDGTTDWSRDDPAAIVASPLVSGDQVIYATEGGTIQSLKKSDGSAIWLKQIDKAQIYTAPLLAGNLILVAPMQTNELIYAYDLNGNQKWTFVPQK